MTEYIAFRPSNMTNLTAISIKNRLEHWFVRYLTFVFFGKVPPGCNLTLFVDDARTKEKKRLVYKVTEGPLHREICPTDFLLYS